MQNHSAQLHVLAYSSVKLYGRLQLPAVMVLVHEMVLSVSGIRLDRVVRAQQSMDIVYNKSTSG